jgi:AAA family ATP:ADP antiporter
MAEPLKNPSYGFRGLSVLTNIIALVIQLFVSPDQMGGSTGLFVLPFIALGGYALISFGAVLVVIRWVKALENGTDYSLQNTTKAALFLITSREEKYKAKAAVDTFFVRGGDTISAVLVLAGTQFLALKIEKYAFLNVFGVAVWILLCVLILKEYRKLRNQGT